MYTIFVGQTVCVVTCGNQVRHHHPPIIYEGTVTKVGRKYFTVSINMNDKWTYDVQFDLVDYREKSEYTPDWAFYINKQAYLDKKEVQNIRDGIAQMCSTGKFFTTDNLHELRKIASMFGIECKG